MIAHLQTVSSTVTAILDPKEIAAAFEGTLTVDGKPVLVTRGNDMNLTVAQIYRLFAGHKDMSGQSFMLSARHKGLVHHDNFGCISKLTNYQFESYLARFCQFAELLTDGNGTHLKLSKEAPALVLKAKCPPFHAQIWQQRRFLQEPEIALFEWVKE